MKIALNVIARNASGTIRDALESTKGAVDVYVIAFAGRSSDLTREVTLSWLEENGVEFIVDEFDFVNFADARNRVLDMTPDDCDWMIWMDADDTIQNIEALRKILEMPEAQEVGCFQFPYIYDYDDYGNPLVIHDRERLVRLSLSWRWNRPCHETLDTPTPHRIVRADNLTWVHNHAATQGRSARNIALLLKYAEDSPEDARTLSYLGHAYFSMQRWPTAIEWFEKAWTNPTNELEKWQAAVFMGRCWFQLDEFDNAIGWAWQAIDIEPRIADPYLLLGACYASQGMNEKAYEFYQMANDKKEPPPVLFVLPNEYTFNRWCYEHFAAAGIGKIEEAIEICKKALKHSPNHRGFDYYLRGYEEAERIAHSKRALKDLVYHLQMRGDALAAVELMHCIPKNIIDDDDMQELMVHCHRAVEHVYDDHIFERVYGEGADISKTNWPMEYLLQRERRDSLLSEPRFAKVIDVVKKHIARVAKSGERLTVVDLGMGDGTFATKLAELGCLVTGIDSNPENVLRAQQIAEHYGVGKRTRFICAQIERLDIQDVGKHDLAVCMELIEHVQNPGMIVGTGLDLADSIVVTTPHQQVVSEWDNTLDGIHLQHVREFHYLDMLSMAFQCGGRFENLDTIYVAPGAAREPGYGTWIGEIVKDRKEKPAIVFYTGGAMEKWSPDSVDEGGIGGSETAAAKMAWLYSKAGHQVFVYGPVDGVWDGVIYRNYKRFAPHNPAFGNPCALFVSSRIPEVFDNPVNAVVKAIWFHDWTYGFDTPVGRRERLTQERAEQIDIMFVLSEAQKAHFEETYSFLKNRLTVTANGIEASRFLKLGEEQQHHRFIWSSSLDRGLNRVLECWPAIKKMWEDAELHIFYGAKLLAAHYPKGHPQREEMVDGLFRQIEELPGVVYHDRVDQRQLAREFAKSQFWFYPTSFTETYCIGAIEAQAAGCTPVTSDVAALADKVPERLRLSDSASNAEFIELLRHIDEGKVEGVTRDERVAALLTTWERVHTQWETVIDEVFEQKVAAHKEAENPPQPKKKAKQVRKKSRKAASE